MTKKSTSRNKRFSAAVLDKIPGSLFKIDQLQRLGDGNKEFIDRMLRLFILIVPESVSEMYEAFTRKDFTAIAAVAHRIKPAVDTMDIKIIKQMLDDIEESVLHKDEPLQLKEMIDSLKETVDRTVLQIKKTLEGNAHF